MPEDRHLNSCCCLAQTLSTTPQLLTRVQPPVSGILSMTRKLPERSSKESPLFALLPKGYLWCQSLHSFVDVNKGNRKHKSAGASQLLWCLDLIKQDRNCISWSSLIIFWNCCIWDVNLHHALMEKFDFPSPVSWGFNVPNSNVAFHQD